MGDHSDRGSWDALSTRELEVLHCLAEGLTDDEIAQKLFLSSNTIKWYNRQIYQKMDVANRTQAVAQARNFGVLDSGMPTLSLDPLLTRQGNHLPAQLTSFVGREREVADVKALVQDKRLLTLTGTGGTGKTRLALEAAADIVDWFEHGVWFVNLAPVTEVDDVAAVIAATFGIKEGEIPIEQILTYYFRSRELLLILDNFEQVIAAAGLVGDLLAEAPRLKVMVTSREVLNLYGEHEYDVPPLGLPKSGVGQTVAALSDNDSVSLFVQRAAAANSSFVVSEENIAEIAAICERLDGLPLAIELAAAQIRMFSVEALLARLDDRFKTLTGGPRNLPKRQQTIYGAIAWSYDLLDEDEKALFARLSVFQGGRSIEAVEAVCMEGLEIDPLEGLESLVNKSLIRLREGRDGEPRFVMLEMIHEFARHQLERRADRESFHRAHALYFTEMATRAHKEYRGARQPYWNAWLDTERANIRTALEWAIEAEEAEIAARLVSMLAVYWWYVGYHREGVAAYERVSALEDRLPDPLKIDFLIHGGLILLMLEDREPARARQREGLALARARGDEYAEAWALQQLGMSYIDTDDPDAYAQAIEMLYASLEISRRLKDQAAQAQTLNTLAEIYRVHGQRELARASCQACLEIVLETREKMREAMMYDIFGILDYEEGNYQDSLTNFKKEVLAILNLRNEGWIPITARHLAAPLAQMGDPEQAARLVGACEKMAEDLGVYLQAGDRSSFERYEQEMRGLLGGGRYEALVEEGRTTMTHEDILAFVCEIVGEE